MATLLQIQCSAESSIVKVHCQMDSQKSLICFKADWFWLF